MIKSIGSVTLTFRSMKCPIRFNSTQLVRTDIINDDVGVIYLNDPARLNALTVPMGKQFVKAVEEMNTAANEQKIRSCIVTGNGMILQCSQLYDCLLMDFSVIII